MRGRSFLESLSHFHGRLKRFRASLKNERQSVGREFKGPVEVSLVLLSASKACHEDRLVKGFKVVESSLIAGMAVAGEDDRRVPVTCPPSRAATHPSMLGRVQARVMLEKI